MWYRVNDALRFNLGFTIDFPLSFLYPPSIHSIRKSCWLFLQTISESKFFSLLPLLHYGMSHLDDGSILQASLPSSTCIPLKNYIYIYFQLAARLTLKSKLLKSKSSHGPISGRRPVCWLPITSLTCLPLLPSLLSQMGLPVVLTHIWTLQLQSLCSKPLLCLEYFPLALWKPHSLTSVVLAQIPSFKMGPHLFWSIADTSLPSTTNSFLNFPLTTL